jgi:VWFA-related protein
MKRFYLPPCVALSVAILAAMPLAAQNQSPSQVNAKTGSQTPEATFKISGKAVLLDVVVTDKAGNPVTGLKPESFTVLEKGKPQTISYFEEHKASGDTKPMELPMLPMNVFTNFTPIQQPAVVNVLLLDSLNTPIEDQAFVHQQAIKFLRGLKPGSRMAIFTMGLGLRFVQGFSDDPAILLAALSSKKSSELQNTMLIQGPQEQLAQQTVLGQLAEVMPAGPGGTVTASTQAMLDALTGVFDRTEQAQTDDRAYRTLENIQHLSRFLGTFPGRKNLIWFSEEFPLTFVGMSTAQFDGTDTRTETRFEDALKKTIDLLTTARIAVYPVDARGSSTNTFYQAQNQMNMLTSSPPEITGENASQQTTAPAVTGVSSAQSAQTTNEDAQRNTDQETMKQLARDSGGKAFVNTNGLAEVISDVVKTSADFYTITYSPENKNMDGLFRPIEVKIDGAKYNLSYRRGYYALDQDLPGEGKIGIAAADAAKMANPLAPVMDFGMPQSEQILYKTMIQPLSPQQEVTATPGATSQEKPAIKSPANRYMVNFAIDLGDVRLKEETDGLHTGQLVVSMVVYDRYGNIVTRKDHIAALNIKPDVYRVYQKTGIQLRDWVEVPRGQYWLRTGVYDAASRRMGTLEIPLSAVKTTDTAAVH